MGTKLLFDTQPLKQELRYVIYALDGMKDMKMDLMSWNDNGIPDFPPYDPVEIAADYLRHVRKWTIESMERQFGRGYIDNIVTDIVYTTPSVSLPGCHLSVHWVRYADMASVRQHWSRAAHNMLFKAITSAGFTREFFKGFRRMMSITELEAPGIYTLRSLLADVALRNRASK